MRTAPAVCRSAFSVGGWVAGRLRLLCDRPDGHRPQPFGGRNPRPGRARGERMQTEGRTVRNIVFMAWASRFTMKHSVRSDRRAPSPPKLFLIYPPGRVLFSTVGIPDAMIRCARRFPDVNLALSLHSVRQDGSRATDPARRQILRSTSSRRGRPGQRDPAKLRDDRVSHARRAIKIRRRRPRSDRFGSPASTWHVNYPVQSDRNRASSPYDAAHERDAFAAIIQSGRPSRPRSATHSAPTSPLLRPTGAIRKSRYAGNGPPSPALDGGTCPACRMVTM